MTKLPHDSQSLLLRSLCPPLLCHCLDGLRSEIPLEILEIRHPRCWKKRLNLRHAEIDEEYTEHWLKNSGMGIYDMMLQYPSFLH